MTERTFTRDEIVELLEEGARERLGISAQELLRRYHAHALEDIGAVADLISLADLLEENDPLLVAA